MITDEYSSAVDLASDIKDKKIAPSEIVEETIKAIDERSSSINAFVYTNYDEARERAKVIGLFVARQAEHFSASQPPLRTSFPACLDGRELPAASRHSPI